MAKEIIPALFLDMFGDPARNARGWEVRRLGDVCCSTFNGGLQVTAKAAPAAAARECVSAGCERAPDIWTCRSKDNIRERRRNWERTRLGR